MTPLRQQMISAMRQHGFSERTHQTYLFVVTQLSRYYQCSPAELGETQIQAYFDHLVQERGLSHASCRLYLHALRFLYLQVLHWPQFDFPVVLPKRSEKIPELLTRRDVTALITHCTNVKHRTMLLTCYGCGLRVSELVALKVRHIDGERHLLRIEQGKGAKDRLVALSDRLLIALRAYWQRLHPRYWLFERGMTPEHHLSVTTIQKAYRRAKKAAGIDKHGGIHALRHAYATHQLEQGLPLHQLQQQLGHRHISTTLHYVHWVARYHAERSGFCDLLDALKVDV